MGSLFFNCEDINTHWEKQEFQQKTDDWARTLHKMKQTKVTPPTFPHLPHCLQKAAEKHNAALDSFSFLTW